MGSLREGQHVRKDNSVACLIIRAHTIVDGEGPSGRSGRSKAEDGGSGNGREHFEIDQCL